jgi:SM-20-related protein
MDCRSVIDDMVEATTVAGAVLRHSRDAVDPRLRRCSEHPLAAAQARVVVAAMREVAGQALDGCPSGETGLDGPKFCSYAVGEYFRAHRDRSEDPLDPATVRNRRLTIVCLLNDADSAGGLPPFDGGALVLHLPRPNGRIEPMNIKPVAGSVIAFRADLMHEVRPVRSGVRYSAIGWLFTATKTEEFP